MRRIFWIVLSVFFWPHPAPVLAAPLCAGSDLLVQLKADDPAAYTALFQRAHSMANARGRFWQVSRGGAAPSYLFGTYHDTEIARQPLDPAVARALGGARLMLVEVTEEEQTRMKARIASDPSFIISAGSTGRSGQLSAQLSASERIVAEKMLAERGVTLAIAEKLRPWMLFSIISVPQCMLAEMKQGQPTLDAVLMSEAAKAGVRVAGMETYEQAIDALAAIPAETMNEILIETLRDLSGEEDARRTAVGLYQAGEIAAIWEFSIVSGAEAIGMARSRDIFAQFAAVLIDARNRAWMKVLALELERGNVFAAFGAGHLPGESGIIELLRSRGFEVIRLDG